uniref:Uncharacterized protein n=1 Tax=Oryza brachyantha TaxID=4533 RepID=J3KWT5_ORYBR
MHCWASTLISANRRGNSASSAARRRRIVITVVLRRWPVRKSTYGLQEGSVSGPPPPPKKRQTLVYSVIVHIEDVLDPTPLHTSCSLSDESNSDDEDVLRRNGFAYWAGRFDGAGPWISYQGGGRSFGVVSAPLAGSWGLGPWSGPLRESCPPGRSPARPPRP